MFPLASDRKFTSANSVKSGTVSSALVREPRLRDFAGRVVASIVKALQKMAGPNTMVEGMLTTFTSERTRDFVSAHRPEVVGGTIHLKDSSCNVVATLDATLVHAIVELLCGGNGVEPPPATPRSATPIDHQFAQIPFSLVAAAIQSEWTELGLGAARASKIDGPLVTDSFGVKVDELVIANVTIGIFGLHGTLRLALPPLILERLAVASSLDSEPTPPDAAWAQLLRQQIGRVSVSLAAYLDAKGATLSALTNLQVGQVLPLPAAARSRASLVAEGRVLYRGELGQDAGRYSLRVEEITGEVPAGVACAAERRVLHLAESRV